MLSIAGTTWDKDWANTPCHPDATLGKQAHSLGTKVARGLTVMDSMSTLMALGEGGGVEAYMQLQGLACPRRIRQASGTALPRCLRCFDLPSSRFHNKMSRCLVRHGRCCPFHKART